MRATFSIIFLGFALANFQNALAQTLNTHNPQLLYDEPGSLFDPSILRELHVVFEDTNYHETLVSSFFNDPSLRISATVTLDGNTLPNVGVRYKGNSTFCLPNNDNSPKVPYNLDFNYWEQGQDLMGYNKVKLANSWLDPTFSKEYLGSKIYRRYLPTPEINAVKLYTQGDYTGLYINTESINKQFLEKHFGEDDGVLFKCDGAGVFCQENGEGGTEGGIPSLSYLGSDSSLYYTSYTIKSDHGWAELLELINTLAYYPENLPEILNVDRVLWAMAANAVINNLDTYNGYYVHNYYLYLDEQGKFQMIPWDLDNSFVGAIMGYNYWNPNEVYHFDPFYTGGGEFWDVRPLTEYLFNHPLYRKQYVAHVNTILEESMDIEELAAEVEVFQNLISEAVYADTNKLFTDLMFSINVDNAIWTEWGFGGILSSAEARVDYFNSLGEITQVQPEIGVVSVNNNIVGTTVLYADSVELMWTPGPYAGDFQSLTMEENFGVYSVPLPEEALGGCLFYIRAFYNEAMSLSPARAEYEYYIYDDTHSASEVARSESFEISPNPARSSFKLNGIALYTDVEVFDLTGRTIHRFKWRGTPVDVASWSTGAYLIRTATGETQKLIIK